MSDKMDMPAPQVEGELITPPKRLTLDRSREYAKEFLDRPVDEVLAEIGKQVATILLLMNDATIGLLERHASTNSEQERRDIQASIRDLIEHSGNVARGKQALLAAIGPGVSDLQVDANGNVVGVKTPMKRVTEGDFESLLGDKLNPFKQEGLSLDNPDQPGTPTA